MLGHIHYYSFKGRWTLKANNNLNTKSIHNKIGSMLLLYRRVVWYFRNDDKVHVLGKHAMKYSDLTGRKIRDFMMKYAEKSVCHRYRYTPVVMQQRNDILEQYTGFQELKTYFEFGWSCFDCTMKLQPVHITTINLPSLIFWFIMFYNLSVNTFSVCTTSELSVFN